MNIPLAIASATAASGSYGALVRLVLNDGTEASIYLEDGSPRNLLHDLLDTWIAAGNTIAPIEP
jgi:hypothetical protein